jgi:hypothetical protein
VEVATRGVDETWVGGEVVGEGGIGAIVVIDIVPVVVDNIIYDFHA